MGMAVAHSYSTFGLQPSKALPVEAGAKLRSVCTQSGKQSAEIMVIACIARTSASTICIASFYFV